MISQKGDPGNAPVTVSLVNDYQVVVEYLRKMLTPFTGRVAVVDMEVGSDAVAPADVALFDTLGGHRHALSRARAMVERHEVGHVVIYARDPSPAFVRAAEAVGVAAVIDQTTNSDEDLVDAIEAVAQFRVRAQRKGAAQAPPAVGELTMHDRELLALLAMGLSNEQIADDLFVDVETVRTHLQHLFQRLGVRNRAQATLQAAAFGVTPVRSHGDDHSRGRRRSKHFRRVPQDVRAARDFVSGVLRRLGATDEEVAAFRLAVSELASNAVMYSGGSAWTVGIKATRECFTMDVSGGEPNAGSVVFHPDLWKIADSDGPEGRGLGIVRHLMDDVSVKTWRGRLRVVCRLYRSGS